MRTHTPQFKEEIKKFGRQIDAKITYTLDGESIELGNEQLGSITPSFQTNILKSAMRELDVESFVEIPLETVINCKFGVLINDEYEYIDYGNYIVKRVEKNEDTNSYNIVCYDKMLNSMINYIQLNHGEFPMTIRDFINNICLDLGIEFANNEDEFANYNMILENDLYANLDYTYRDVLDELAGVTASTICINDEDKLEIRYINETNDEIDENYLKSNNVKFSKKYGPINSIVLSRAGGSDNVFLRDETSVYENGLCEVKIIDNQIMNFNDRDDYLPAILEKLNGLEYFPNDLQSTGVCYYDICDSYNVRIGENVYNCVMFNDQITITQGLEESIYTEFPENSEIDYTKSDKTDRRINQAYLIVDKQNQTIEGVVSKTEDIDKNTNNNYLKILAEVQETRKDLSEIQNIKTIVTQLQTDTYTKAEVQEIVSGTNPEGVLVETVSTASGTFDKNGLTIEQSANEGTKTNINSNGMIIYNKNSSSENDKLLEVNSDGMVAKNIKVSTFLNMGSHSRFEDYVHTNGWYGTGCFWIS